MAGNLALPAAVASYASRMDLPRPALMLLTTVVAVSALVAGRTIWVLVEDPLRLLRLLL